MDRESQCHLDCREARQGAMAAFYRRRYDSRARRPAAGDARGAKTQSWRAELFAAPDSAEVWHSELAHAAGLLANWPWLTRPRRFQIRIQRIAAANGQFLLVEREAYRSSADTPALLTRCSKMWNSPILPSGAESDCGFATRTMRWPRECIGRRGAMIEGWTKNLALLFDNTLVTAFWRALDIAASVRSSRVGG